jgi:hypothetical protein
MLETETIFICIKRHNYYDHVDNKARWAWSSLSEGSPEAVSFGRRAPWVFAMPEADAKKREAL